MTEDKRARDRLIEQNIGLVHACAGRFRARGIDYEDLFQAGCVGLCKAADGFDETRGYAFSTYAVPTILGEIRRLFRDGGAVKVGRSVREKARRLAALQQKFAADHGREPLLSELADEAGLDAAQTAFLLNAALPVVSLTVPDEADRAETDVPVPPPDDGVETKVAVESLLASLDGEERLLIELRFFHGWTQSRVALRLGVSQVQVSRREKAILHKLRAYAIL